MNTERQTDRAVRADRQGVGRTRVLLPAVCPTSCFLSLSVVFLKKYFSVVYFAVFFWWPSLSSADVSVPSVCVCVCPIMSHAVVCYHGNPGMDAGVVGVLRISECMLTSNLI